MLKKLICKFKGHKYEGDYYALYDYGDKLNNKFIETGIISNHGHLYASPKCINCNKGISLVEFIEMRRKFVTKKCSYSINKLREILRKNNNELRI